MRKESRKKKNKLNEFIFDGCSICQAMKAADAQGRSLSLSELKKAFVKASKKTEYSYVSKI